MTIEGRPTITGADEFNDNIYKTRRKDRLTDIVSDYLTDENTSEDEFYDDVMSELDTWIDYHKHNLEKTIRAKEKFQPKTYQIQTSQFLAEDRITNYPGTPIKIGEDPVIFGA